MIDCLGRMGGGEVFVPKIPSMRVTDIAEALAPDAERRVIGIRPGEKLHELLVTEDESRHSYELDDRLRDPARVRVLAAQEVEGGTPLPDGFRYSSDNNDVWLDVDELREMARDVKPALA